MPNVKLLRETMDYVLAHPDEHNQRIWGRRTTCGTTYCFAGAACLLAGYEFEFDSNGDTEKLTNGVPIPYAARKLLDIDRDTAMVLFWYDNDTTRLKEVVDEICEYGKVSFNDAS